MSAGTRYPRSGTGYWLAVADGGIFAFDALFRGSMGATKLNKPVTGMVSFGNSYLMVAQDGGIFNFSDPLSRITRRQQPAPSNRRRRRPPTVRLAA